MGRERISVPGLGRDVRITVDRWGIAHIRAANLRDLFFAQGFNAGRDRLWQIDLWRKRGLGLLAGDFGPGYLEQDRASRLFLYRGDMGAEWSSYSADAKAICDSFTAGINAYIDLIEREPERLPDEFTTMGTRPAKWRAEDVVRIRSHALSGNAISETIRTNVMAKSDASTDLLRQNLEPRRTPRPARGIDLTAIPMDVLDLFMLATTPVTFSPERLAASLDEARLWLKLTPLGDVIRAATEQGSNNWVVHGSRTKSGRPILANDPHRPYAVPSLRYIVHLSAPGLDVIGAGEPAIPGVSVGHNGTAAFGMTMFSAVDQEDTYVYETAPDDPGRYRYKKGWESMRVLEESIPVKGHPDQKVILRFTRHGPVIFERPDGRQAIAIRSVWFAPGTAAYLGSIRTMRSKSFEEFRVGMASWGTPAINQVYADKSGTIGWIGAGKSPIRKNWDGLLPVPGNGRYEWKGFLDPLRMPYLKNPTSGFIATANEMNLPPAWLRRGHRLGYEWIENARVVRIKERIKATMPHTIKASCALQTDIVSIPARRVGALITGLQSDDIRAKSALAMLHGWNHELRADSGPAALFEVWWTKHLRPTLIARLAPNTTARQLIGVGDPASILQLLEKPDRRLGTSPRQMRDQLLLVTLAKAFADCATRMGSDPSSWAWGRLHRAHFIHAVNRSGRGASSGNRDVGPLPHGGSDSTPMQSRYSADDFSVVLGASVRAVIDVGRWDNSVCINVPGQCGLPGSLHYADLADKWADGNYVPLLYSAKAVNEQAETLIDLVATREKLQAVHAAEGVS